MSLYMPLAHSGAFRPGKTTAGSDAPARSAGSALQRNNCRGVPFKFGTEEEVPRYRVPTKDPESRPPLGGPYLTPSPPLRPRNLGQRFSLKTGD